MNSTQATAIDSTTLARRSPTVPVSVTRGITEPPSTHQGSHAPAPTVVHALRLDIVAANHEARMSVNSPEITSKMKQMSLVRRQAHALTLRVDTPPALPSADAQFITF
jgi:hypothetical protein